MNNSTFISQSTDKSLNQWRLIDFINGLAIAHLILGNIPDWEQDPYDGSYLDLIHIFLLAQEF